MNAKVKVNPIVKKDLKVISRSMKFSWGLFAYECILGIIFFFVMLAMGAFTTLTGSQRNTDIYEGFVAFFPIIGVAQLCMISFAQSVQDRRCRCVHRKALRAGRGRNAVGVPEPFLDLLASGMYDRHIC